MNDTKNLETYFKYHVFFCLNERTSPQSCCAQHNAKAAFEHCKQKVKTLELNGVGAVRVNKAGCLDRCAGGPVLVVYPQAIWYTFVDLNDIDEIVESHFKNDQIVARLQLHQDVGR